MAWIDGKTDIKDWKKVNKEALTLMLKEGETLLKETVDTAGKITLRADKYLTILLPIATALATYVLSTFSTGETWKFLPITAILCLAVIASSGFYYYQAFKPYEIKVPGTEPEFMLTEEFVGNRTDDEQFKVLAFAICEELQSKIKANRKFNETRDAFMVKATKILLYLLTAPIISFLFCVLLSHHWNNCVFPM